MPATKAPIPTAATMKPKLRDGGVGQHFLDVILPDGNRGGEQGGDRAHQRDDVLRLRHQRVERRGTRHQVDTRGDHGGGMDEGRDRGGAGHGIRQPDVERDLGRLARHADQHEQGDEQDDTRRDGSDLGRLAKDIAELEAAESTRTW